MPRLELLSSDQRLTVWSRPLVRRLLLIGLACGLILGVFQSWKAVFHYWGADSDIADPVLLWHGLRTQGLSFITSWQYTPDNWLLSLMPFDFLAFLLFGDSPAVVIGSGLVAFYLTVLLCAGIIARERGALIGGVAAMVLLLSGQAALTDGFLTYAVSHNISLVWGLLAVLLSTNWLAHSRWRTLIGAAICLFVGSLSDPWCEVAFLLPIAGASLALLILGNLDSGRKPPIILFAMTVIVALLVRDRLFSIFHFFPSPPHQFATWSIMKDNLILAARYIAVFINILPGSITIRGEQAPVYALVIDCAAFAAILVVCLWRLARRSRLATARQLFLAITALSSMALMAVALVLSEFATGMVTTRYFANFFVFIPILLAVTPMGTPSSRTRDGIAVGALCTLLIISSVISNKDVWTWRWPSVRLNGIPQLATFLTSHNLSFGYGPYWPAEANAMAWVSHDAVTIRPINFNDKVGRFGPKTAQTLPAWYRQEGIRDRPDRMFLMVAAGADGCGADTACSVTATAQFGKPTSVLHYGAWDILTYNHKIIPQFAPVVGDYWKSFHRTLSWMGRYVEIYAGSDPLDVTISGKYRPANLPPVTLSISRNGQPSAYEVASNTQFTFQIPPRSFVTIRAAKTFVPHRILHNDDFRHLSVLIAVAKQTPTSHP